jgi:tetratricopeptide (TPR) repeat protein
MNMPRLRGTNWLAVVILGSLCAAVVGGGAMVGCSSSRSPSATMRSPRGVDRYVQAVQAYQGGNRDRAVDRLLAATRVNPDLIMARVMLGDLYRESGDYPAARKQYEALITRDPYSWSNHYKLGVTYQFLDRLNDASASYERALKLNPDDANTNMNLGLVHLYLDNRDAAVRYTEQATLLDPRSAPAFSNLGVALDARGDFARAESAYRHSLDLDPDNLTTLLNLGTNLIAQNKTAEAVDIMQRVVQAEDSPTHRKRFGDALSRAGRYDEAVKQYQAVLGADPNYYPALNEIGFTRIAEYRKNLQLDDAKRNEAIAMWDKSLAINPDQPQIQAAKQQWSGRAELFRK